MEAHAQAAYQQGLAAGEAAAAQHASERLEPVLASLNGVVQELAGQRKRLRTEAEEDTVKLAVAVARRVLHRELATDPDAILGLVIAAFQKLNARETNRLRVSPADAAALQENRARLELPVNLEIAADGSLAPGSAVFETARGELDASVDTQLAEIQRGFADLIRRRAT
jgi:flagellar assembly protein FliH